MAILSMLVIVSVVTSDSLGETAVASVDRESVQIADPFQFTVSITAANVAKVRFPEVAETLGPFQVLSHQDRFDIPVETGRRWSRTYELEAYESGDLQIPSLSIAVDGATSKTKPTAIQVKSDLGESADPTQFRPAKDIVDLPAQARTTWPIWAAFGAFLVAAAALVWLIKKRRRDVKPEAWALARIDELKRTSHFAAGDQTHVLPPLVDILREYIHRRFGIAAPQQTTEEFLAFAKTDTRLEVQQRSQLNTLWQQVDQIKFAHYVPGTDRMQEAFRTAESFVEETSHPSERREKEPA